MATLRFTSALKRFFPDLSQIEVEGGNVAELIDNLDKRYPGLSRYLLEDHGGLRKHVNIYVNGERIADRLQLSDTLQSADEVFVLQALSGG